MATDRTKCTLQPGNEYRLRNGSTGVVREHMHMFDWAHFLGSHLSLVSGRHEVTSWRKDGISRDDASLDIVSDALVRIGPPE